VPRTPQAHEARTPPLVGDEPPAVSGEFHDLVFLWIDLLFPFMFFFDFLPVSPISISDLVTCSSFLEEQMAAAASSTLSVLRPK
jgi:hypothetical protein